MVEARVRRLPGYSPMPDYDDGASEAGAFLWRLGDAFELWDEQGDALEEEEMRQECQPDAQPAGAPEVRVFSLRALTLCNLWLMGSLARQECDLDPAAAYQQFTLCAPSSSNERMQGRPGSPCGSSRLYSVSCNRHRGLSHPLLCP